MKKTDPKTTKVEIGTTPFGGDYSILYFFDENEKPCSEEESKGALFVVYDNDDNELYTQVLRKLTS